MEGSAFTSCGCCGCCDSCAGAAVGSSEKAELAADALRLPDGHAALRARDRLHGFERPRVGPLPDLLTRVAEQPRQLTEAKRGPLVQPVPKAHRSAIHATTSPTQNDAPATNARSRHQRRS